MKLIIAEDLQIEKLVDISVRAFDSDINVGADAADGPPDYDSIAWHRQMADEGHLYQAMEGDIIVGDAIFLDTPEWNIRTNSFYRKLAYKMYKQEEGFNFYKFQKRHNI